MHPLIFMKKYFDNKVSNWVNQIFVHLSYSKLNYAFNCKTNLVDAVETILPEFFFYV